MQANRVIGIDELGIFDNLKNRKTYIITFLTAFVGGFFSFGFSMSNGFINGDGLVYGYRYLAGAWDVSQGRWFLPFLDGRFLSSWYEGLLSILILALSASILVVFLKVKSVSGAILIGLLISTQTHFAQWQGSPYILFPYSFAFCIAILSAQFMWIYIENNKKIYAIAGILLLTISLGIYQAYLAITVLLLYIKIIEKIAKNASYNYISKNIGKIFILCLVTGITYYLCMKVQMKRYGVSATSGRGWADVLKGDLYFFQKPIETIRDIYSTFVKLLCVDGLINFSITHKLIYFILAIVVLSLFILFCRKNKGVLRKIIVGALLGLIPMVVMMLMILTETIVPWSMFPAIIFIPIFVVVYERKVYAENSSWRNTLQWIVSICCIIVVFEAIYIGNINYVNLQKRYQKTYAQSIRILDRIETYEEYEEGIPVVLVGSLQNTYPNTLTSFEHKLQGYEAYVMDWLIYPDSKSYLYINFISDYLGVQLVAAENYNEKYNEIINTEWYKDMKAFPAEECIVKYGDVLVVKLSD